ncbi:DUF4407 domain-containing protein [Microbispora sp. NEAU-D428]|uniref:DUF4407 domain-containing protein n=1 Tax=Microbispora sitophila TaxID=2771537 RepID=UPI0018680B44|nr:DUF4407 domain-containing protein [Microbispora sitophila]MBE3013368.1 DUF4407 domain-containing protein [Microbispora sitophila]
MLTLKERVELLEQEVMDLGKSNRLEATIRAYDAQQMIWVKVDAISERLTRVEQIGEQTRTDIGVLKSQMAAANRRFDRLDHEIARLDGRIDELSNRVDTLTGQVDTLTGQVETLGGQVETLTGRVDGLTTRVDTLTNRVDTLTGQVSVLSGHIDALTSHVDGLTGQVDTLTGRVDGLTTRVDAVNDQLTTLTDRVDAMADHMGRSAELNKTMFNSVLTRLEDLYAHVRMSNLVNSPERHRAEPAEDGPVERSA